jgi:peptide/nickel transport system substrate-binding protein
MAPFPRWGATPWRLAVPIFALFLLLAAACGTAAQQGTTAAPQPTAAAGQNIPTTAPQQVDTPSEVQVSAGKLTWMVASWGTGRFVSVVSGTGVGNNYARILHGFPIAANEKGEMIPGIATDWGVSEDGLTWTVNIRDGVKFHDGSDVTAEDVAWTWEHNWGPQSLDYAVSTTSQAQARITERIEVTGPNQITATLNQVASGFPSGILAEAGPNWLGHVLPQRDEIYNEAAAEAYDRAPIGAGPMRLVRHVQSEVMAFERFDDFYYQPANGLPEDRRVKFANLDLRLVPEESTRVAALRAGEADIVPASLTTRSQVESGGGRLVFGPEGVYLRPALWGCWSSNTHIPCHDQRVRQALAYALDKDLIRDRLYGGTEVFETRGWQFATPSALGYGPELDPFPYDPDRARQLLADAGYAGGQGFGKFIVNTWVSASMPFLPEGAQLAADMWRRELGLDVEVRVGDEGALNRASRTPELHGQMTWRDNEARLDGASILLSSYGSPEQGNRFHEDPELYQAVADAISVVDPEQRSEALNQLYRRLQQENYEIGIGYVNIPWGVGPRVKTWQPFAFSFFPSGIHTITLE